MTQAGGRTDPFAVHAALAAAVMVAGGVVATVVVPMAPETRLAACWGVGLAAATGVVAMALKRRVGRQDLKGAMKVVAVVFALRALCMGAGLVGVVTRGLAALPFVAGFFGVYFALQWVELSYVMAATKQAAGGDE